MATNNYGGTRPPNPARRRKQKIKGAVAGRGGGYNPVSGGVIPPGGRLPGPGWRRNKTGRHPFTANKPNRNRPNRRKPGFKDPYRDQQYFNDVSGAQYKKESALNNFENQEQQTRIGYGFDTDIATNPYSRAALLQKNYDRAQTGTLNQMAAGGQLYSGATSNARAANTSRYNQDYNQTRASYDAELEKLRAGRQEADTDFRLAKTSADQAALDRAKRERPDAETSPVGKRGRPFGKKKGKKGRGKGRPFGTNRKRGKGKKGRK